MKATCTGPECARLEETRGLCAAHYAQTRRGKQLTKLREKGFKEPNVAIEIEDCYVIVLTDRQGKMTEVAFVSKEDIAKVQEHRWCLIRCGASSYAVRQGEGEHRMHRLIMGSPGGMEVDHKDRNGLNNTRENLRIVTHAENGQNMVRKGRVELRGIWCDVNKPEGSQRWQVACQIKGVRHRSTHKTEEEAIAAARELRKKHLPFAVD